MRKFAIIVLGCLFALCACAGCKGKEKIVRITDVGRYAEMQNAADRIEVRFDNDTGNYFLFSVTDENDLNEIMEIVFSETLFDMGEEVPPPGNNTGITVLQGEKAYAFSVSVNEENWRYYAFSTDALKTKIIDLAAAAGAYDTQIGVIYKIIALSELDRENENTLVGGYEQTALRDLIAGGLGGEYRFVCLFETETETEAYYNLRLSETLADTYTDQIAMSEGEVLISYRIFQKYGSDSYYVSDTMPSEFVGIPAANWEFTLGKYRPRFVKIAITS